MGARYVLLIKITRLQIYTFGYRSIGSSLKKKKEVKITIHMYKALIVKYRDNENG